MENVVFATRARDRLEFAFGVLIFRVGPSPCARRALSRIWGP